MPDLSLIPALDGMVGAPAFAPANDGHINRKEQNDITRTATIRSHFTVIIPYSVYKITIEKMKTYKKSSLYYYMFCQLNNDFYV